MATKSKPKSRSRGVAIHTKALPSGVWTREEALEMIADFVALVGVAAHGRRNHESAPPFAPEIRAAAGFIAQVDLPNIIRALASCPEAPSVKLVRDPKARGEAVELLSLTSLYVDAPDRLADRADHLLEVVLPRITGGLPAARDAVDQLVSCAGRSIGLEPVEVVDSWDQLCPELEDGQLRSFRLSPRLAAEMVQEMTSGHAASASVSVANPRGE